MVINYKNNHSLETSTPCNMSQFCSLSATLRSKFSESAYEERWPTSDIFHQDTTQSAPLAHLTASYHLQLKIKEADVLPVARLQDRGKRRHLFFDLKIKFQPKIKFDACSSGLSKWWRHRVMI